MRTERGFDRLMAFADAVVAIAMTLLVLPLVDLSTEEHDDVGALLREGRWTIAAFVLSFVVIGWLWQAQHRITEPVGRHDVAVVRWTLAWLFTVVLLPFPTELLGEGDERGTNALYVGTLLASSCCLAVLRQHVQRHPELLREGVPPAAVGATSWDVWSTPATFAAALVVAVALPAVGLWALLLLVVEPRATRLARTVLRRRRR